MIFSFLWSWVLSLFGSVLSQVKTSVKHCSSWVSNVCLTVSLITVDSRSALLNQCEALDFASRGSLSIELPECITSTRKQRFVCSVAFILSCEMFNLGGRTAALDIWCPATGGLLSKTTVDLYCSTPCWISNHFLWYSSLCREEFVGCWGCLGILMLGAHLGLCYSLELTFVLRAVFVKANYSVFLFYCAYHFIYEPFICF